MRARHRSRATAAHDTFTLPQRCTRRDGRAPRHGAIGRPLACERTLGETRHQRTTAAAARDRALPPPPGARSDTPGGIHSQRTRVLARQRAAGATQRSERQPGRMSVQCAARTQERKGHSSHAAQRCPPAALRVRSATTCLLQSASLRALAFGGGRRQPERGQGVLTAHL